MSFDYDLFVIGGGSGGIRAARWSSQLGARVALCESYRLGGTCVIRGCVPKKFMFYGSEFSKQFKRSEAYGWKPMSPELDWLKFNTTRAREISRLEGIYSRILSNNDVDFKKGHGQIVSANTIKVGDKTYTSKYILIAVGGKPHLLDLPGAELAITSEDIFDLPSQPQSLLVLGSGYIGLEFASIFNSLGTDVTLMFRKPYVLSGFDKDVRRHLQEELIKKGLRVFAETEPVSLKKEQDQIEVLDNQGRSHKVSQVLMATGRRPRIDQLNLQALGVKTTKRDKLLVDKNFETSCKGIFALGDCAETPYELTPVATSEAMVFSEKLFSKTNKDMDYSDIPSAIFTQPTVGTVGLSEEQAQSEGYETSIFETQFRALKLSLTEDDEKTYMKLIVCKKSDRVLGLHMIGEGADEILQGFAVAIKAGLTKQQFDNTIGIHPTSAEELVTLRTAKKS